ncbi:MULTISPECIES: ABC transporter substrate-binding protein [unclassified Chelatococcus]|uniref:ABC transporter substrate-binding protein n=1 Tax=unclassified Chelatococcus TaxID=2638111 RepID=UPI001BD0F33D|nr:MULTISPECIES: ABC transporter substrate-binding protein [unclassified Chelatococcus]MBS7700437.1 ABC transporter substrate-binding protein [Chelatococcus sp. YT9]MBX3556233.1 ABC transporter substrate-binding protein [Chelatococcus sp.]
MLTRRSFTKLSGAALAAPTVLRSAHAQSGTTLVVAATRTPGGFDGDSLKPNTQNVVVQVYEGLTRYARAPGSDGRERIIGSKVEPHLAESWTVSPDGKVYTFKLRQGAKSFFGNEMTAEDVVWGWNKSLAQNRTGAFIARVSSVTKVEAVSPYEVRFTLSDPSLLFLRALTLYTPSIYDSKVAKEHATADDPWALKWLDQNTAGFGPYHLQQLRPGADATFVANPNYFAGKPHFQRVIYREVPSAANRVALMRSGQAHWTEELTQRQIVELQRDKRVRVEREEGTGHASVRMNMNFDPFKDRRVRQALLYATDYNALNQSVFEGLGTQAKSIVPPAIEGHDGSAWVFDTDIEKAKALLAEAGHPNGLTVTVEYSQIFWWEEPLVIQLRSQFQKVGITLELKQITDADMRARTAPNRRDLPCFTFLDNPIVLDGVYTLYLNAHSQGASNRNDYRNPEFDALVDKARIEIDPDKRNAMIREAQRIHTTDATWLMTLYPGSFESMAPNIRGWVWQPDLHERWVDLRIEKS